MHKKKAVILVVSIAFAVILIAVIIYILIPIEIMKFHFDDNRITITISRYKAIGPFADPDYNIKIEETGKVFDQTLLDEDFEHNTFKHGILKESSVSIEWYDDHVDVLIKKTKGAYKVFTAKYQKLKQRDSCVSTSNLVLCIK